ncbi:hypothetical protein LSCM4_05845 [Leishmania orientalis]|uniref:Uncharacterized protein n=1 Tax=Leishmania orientalis TaxID=2249476 RepID=A0A836H5E4_9TRYP|nr:hypothetical protein LSCM4_05845 [Leishmania orientalis]
MLTRVGALLEAIDKKTEELAKAADEKDRAWAAEQQQEQLRNSSGLSSATWLQHYPTLALHPARGNGDGGAADESCLRGLARGHGTAADGSSSAFPAEATPPSATASVTRLASHEANAESHAPLSLPTKRPSFRPSLPDAAADDGRGGPAAGWKQHLTLSTVACPSIGSSPVSSQGNATTLPSAAPGNSEPAIISSTAEAALVRLEGRCKALEADKIRWQQEAATHRAQCSATRDALWKAEQDARASRAAQRAAEQALTVYKETSQRLLDEAQHEVKRARDAAAGQSPATEAQQQEATQDAQELHQRLELLQADHASLNAEVERYRQEAANAVAELQHVQERHRQEQMRVDALQLEVGAVRESLEGEVTAHAETRSALRRLQTQKEEVMADGSSPSLPAAATAKATGEAGPAADMAQLQSELNELKQRHQMLILQASSRQAALDAATREAEDMKERYNELAKQVNDAEVEIEAGFRASTVYGGSIGSSIAFPAPPSASSKRGHRGFGPGSSVLRGHSADSGAHWAQYAGDAATTPESSSDARRRNPTLARLARQYGIAGRAFVAFVCSIDSAAVHMGLILTQARWVWRVALMCYIGLLQIWVLLMIIGTLALEDSVYVREPARLPEPLAG